MSKLFAIRKYSRVIYFESVLLKLRGKIGQNAYDTSAIITFKIESGAIAKYHILIETFSLQFSLSLYW